MGDRTDVGKDDEAESTSRPPVPSTMPAVVGRHYGTPDVLSIEEVPTPAPGNGEVLVGVEAASLNALDWHFLTGTPYFMRAFAGLRRPKRTIPGADVAGAIVAVGPGVTRYAPGDEVFGESDGGACAPFVAVDAEHVARKPSDVEFDAAAATPVAGLTALQGLRTHADVKAGDRVLVNGAAGGVGTNAVQIAKAIGAHVTAVCSTRNVEMVRSLGADEVVDYTRDDFVAGGSRFDVMFDGVGNRSAAECLGVLTPGGRYVGISGPKDNLWLGPIPHLLRLRVAFRRTSQTFHQFTEAPNEADLVFLGELLSNGGLRPEIERVIGLDGVAGALEEIGTGHTRAKIVVHPLDASTS